MVEHAPVKRRVVGSSPTIPVTFDRMYELKREGMGSTPIRCIYAGMAE